MSDYRPDSDSPAAMPRQGEIIDILPDDEFATIPGDIPVGEFIVCGMALPPIEVVPIDEFDLLAKSFEMSTLTSEQSIASVSEPGTNIEP